MTDRAKTFPFEDGRPFAPSLARWAIALLSVAAGLTALMVGGRAVGQPAAVLTFTALPFFGLLILTGGRPGLVFRRLTFGDLGVGIAFALLNLVATGVTAWLVSRLLHTAPNPVSDTLAAMSLTDLPAFFALTGVQLIGEELVTVIPFLGTLALASHLGVRRSASVVVAAVAAALVFAAMHFPTYQWHVLQTVIIIGSARLVLLGAYLLTRNLWASVIAHILNDWILFAGLILLAHLTS